MSSLGLNELMKPSKPVIDKTTYHVQYVYLQHQQMSGNSLPSCFMQTTSEITDYGANAVDKSRYILCVGGYLATGNR